MKLIDGSRKGRDKLNQLSLWAEVPYVLTSKREKGLLGIGLTTTVNKIANFLSPRDRTTTMMLFGCGNKNSLPDE
jgi:hypothetical protein